jgi:hypothetical protein
MSLWLCSFRLELNEAIKWEGLKSLLSCLAFVVENNFTYSSKGSTLK